MKILLAVHQFDDPSAGGTEVYTAALARELSRRHEVAVLYPSKNSEGGRRVDEHGVRHFALGGGGAAQSTRGGGREGGGGREKSGDRAGLDPRHDPFAASYTGDSRRAAIERAVQEFRPDVLHVQHLSGLGLALLEAARDVPRAVMTLADYWPFCPRGQMIRDDLEICARPDPARCAACVFVSPEIRNLENRARGRIEWAAGLAGLPLLRRGLDRVLEPLPVGEAAAKAAGEGGFPSPRLSPGGGEVGARARFSLAALVARMGGFVPAVRDAREKIESRLSRIERALARVDLFLAPSRFIGGRYAALGVPYHKIRHLDYGFEQLGGDPSVVGRSHAPLPVGEAAAKAAGEGGFPSPRPSPGGRGSKSLRLGFVGTLIPSKGAHVIAQALGLLPKGTAEIHFYGQFVNYHGDDSYKDVLRQKLSGLPHVFHGPLPHANVAEALARMDALVVPSVWPENSPLVIHEALQAGVPVIASRIGGIPELVREGQTGLLFRVGDAGDLARCIEDVASGRVRFEGRETWKAAVEPIEEHARRIEAIYREGLEGVELP